MNAASALKHPLLLVWLAVAVSGSWAGLAQAAVYKYVDPKGIVHYTDRKPGTGQSYDVIVLDSARHTVDWSTVPLNLTDYSTEIKQACNRFGVSTALVRAVIHAESWFQLDARSSMGAEGLMQLMPAVQTRFGVTNAYDASENIAAGVQYLSELLQAFDGDTELAAAAYNAGPNAVKQYHGVPPYPQTQDYVERVGTLHQRYRQAM